MAAGHVSENALLTSDFNGIQMHGLCDAGAIVFRLL